MPNSISFGHYRTKQTSGFKERHRRFPFKRSNEKRLLDWVIPSLHVAAEHSWYLLAIWTLSTGCSHGEVFPAIPAPVGNAHFERAGTRKRHQSSLIVICDGRPHLALGIFSAMRFLKQHQEQRG
jgi:hypothetical protein